MDELHLKQQKLEEYLKSLGAVAVAFSAGVDSTFLLAEAQKALGDNIIAVTADICSFPKQEFEQAVFFCSYKNITLKTVKIDLMKIDEFRTNQPDRCYHCKKAIVAEIAKTAKENGFDYIAEGSNADDSTDYRPGAKAIKEAGILSPLALVGLSKQEIRLLSEEMGLPSSSKPSLACLATRFETGEELTAEKLERVNLAEEKLRRLGAEQVRVRVHSDVARIETSEEGMTIFIDAQKRAEISSYFKKLGFIYVCLDLDGYITGSMNKTSKNMQ